MSLHVCRRENKGQPELVLLHGWGMGSDVWEAFAQILSPFFSLTLIDLPGLGRSSQYPMPYTAESVVDMLAEAAPDKAIWLGWSMGGQVSVEYATKYPARVNALITVASNPCFVQRDDWLCAMDESTHQKFEQALEANQAKTLQRFIMLQTQGALEGRETLKMLKRIIKDVEPAAAKESLVLLRDDVRDKLSGLSMPVLQLFGEKDLLVPAEASTACELLAGTTVKVYPEAGHLPFCSHGDEVLADIREFLQGSMTK